MSSLVAILVTISQLSLPIQGTAVSHPDGIGSLRGWHGAQPGVVVENIKPSSEGARAGLQPGDIVLSWKRGDSSGKIESPFDFDGIEAEQQPLGTVELEGLRGRDKKTWPLGLADWGLEVRPNFTPWVLSQYLTATKTGKTKKSASVMKAWQTILTQENALKPSWLAPWLLAHAADMVANDKDWATADKLYQKAAQRALDSKAAGQLYRRWGERYQQRNDWSDAEARFQQSLSEFRKTGSQSFMAATILSSLGNVARSRGDLVRSEEYHRQALAMRSLAAPGSLSVAKSLDDLATVAIFRGKLAEAEELAGQALSIQQQLDPTGLDMAISFQNLGGIALKRDDLDRCESYYLKALAIFEKMGADSIRVGLLLGNLGALALERGDLVKADQYSRRSLEIENRWAPDSLYVATTLNNIGSVAKDRGDLDQAEQYLRMALAIRERLAPDSFSVAASLQHLGAVATDQGKPAEAEVYLRRALAIREKQAPDSVEYANTLDDLGEAAGKLGDMATAESCYLRSLAIAEKVAPESLYVAAPLHRLADISRARGDLEKAKEYYHRAVAIREKVAPESAYEAASLAGLGSIARQEGQLDTAAQFFERAVKALESHRSRIGGTQESRALFHAERLAYYTDYMEVLLAQNKADLAFQVLERSRARSLLEMLGASRIDIGTSVDPELLASEQSIQQLIDAKYEERIKTINQEADGRAASVTEREIAALIAKRQEVEQEIRERSPGYAALAWPRTLTVSEVQQQLLDEDTVLLEYSLGNRRSVAWVITSSSSIYYTLPDRTLIEDTARRFYKLLTARNRRIQGETSRQRYVRLANSQADYPATARSLSAMVLGPVWAALRGKRLLIVSDGALQYIPFSALPIPPATDAPETPDPTPLVNAFEIVSLPSASVLAELRRMETSRALPQRGVAVLADPVFDRADIRVRHAPLRNHSLSAHAVRSQPRLPERLTRSAEDIEFDVSGGTHLARLPFTRVEAQAILAATLPEERFAALDFKANRKTVQSLTMSKYKIVHFATHGLIDNQHPELSGLVLSLVDEMGRPVNGFLDLQDIYKLNMPVDLVVLSACATALGREIQGEGLVGLTRGFMYAGAPRVVASLWQVDDLATSRLMGTFYRAMEKDGLQPPAALRYAQLEMLKQSAWKDPFYWAGFSLQGEWK